jgi:hypothetical protein
LFDRSGLKLRLLTNIFKKIHITVHLLCVLNVSIQFFTSNQIVKDLRLTITIRQNKSQRKITAKAGLESRSDAGNHYMVFLRPETWGILKELLQTGSYRDFQQGHLNYVNTCTASCCLPLP